MSDSIEIIPDTGPVQEAGAIADMSEKIAAFSSVFHIDINDGIFTKDFSWPYYMPGEYMHFGMLARKPRVEVHLMVQNPREIGCLAAHAGAFRIIAHIECMSAEDPKALFEDWKAAGAQEIGVAILLETPISALESIASICDVVQVMTIAHVGKSGAPFDARSLEKVAEVHRAYPNVLIAADGGVSLGNIPDLVRHGARRFAVGKNLMQALDPSTAYQNLKTAAESALQ